MNAPEDFVPVLAYCSKDQSSYVVAHPGVLCAICGAAPDWILPFYSVAELGTGQGPEGVSPPPLRDAVDAPYQITCPHCRGAIDLTIEEGAMVVVPGASPATDAAQPESIPDSVQGEVSSAAPAADGSPDEGIHPNAGESTAAPVAPASE